MPVTELNNHRAKECGFALLTELWLILLLGVLISSIIWLGLSTSKEAANTSKTTRQNLALEAAFHQILFDLLKNDGKSRWAPLTGEVSASLKYDGFIIEADISDHTAKVDLNSAPDAVIETFLIGGGFSAQAASRFIYDLRGYQRRLPDPKRIGLLDELIALQSINREILTCLGEHLTFYTGAARPNLSFASSALRKAFSEDRSAGTRSVFSARQSVSGRALRSRLALTNGQYYVPPLTVDIRLTGSQNKPYWIYSWRREYAKTVKSYPNCI